MTYPSGITASLQKTQTWLNGIGERLAARDQEAGYHATRAVLQTLRDRLPVTECNDLAAQLPMILRGLYFEGWHPASVPQKFDGTAFIDQVQQRLPANSDVDPMEAIAAVSAQLRDNVTPGELNEALNMLPGDVRSLFAMPQAA